ncbi:MAG TPA: kelch repeat-containing protein, partial [Candidatus Limnocylindria bacterium]|nr:kelch repeat-containing protein [Candidatus Limnocylindria bacterium]
MPSLVFRSRALAAALLGSALLVGCMSSTPPSSPGPSMTPSSELTASGSPSVEPSPSEVAIAWRQLAPTGGPVPREDHTWTVDDDGAVAYLFGGRDATGPGTLDDFWAFDL